MFLLDISPAPYIIGYVVVFGIIGALALGAVIGAIFLIRKALKKKSINNYYKNLNSSKDNNNNMNVSNNPNDGKDK